jgi:hypothetical protein
VVGPVGELGRAGGGGMCVGLRLGGLGLGFWPSREQVSHLSFFLFFFFLFQNLFLNRILKAIKFQTNVSGTKITMLQHKCIYSF